MNSLFVETTNCAGFDAEPPRSALSACTRALIGSADTPQTVASLGREWQLTGDDFMTTNFGSWPTADECPTLNRTARRR
jgi:hypothetical protein